MKVPSLLLIQLVLATTPTAMAWSTHRPTTSTTITNTPTITTSSRRKILAQGVATLFTTTITTTTVGSTPAVAGLLEEYGTDPSKIQQPESSAAASATATRKEASVIEPNLRSNYYYPTNKKRYLPRIKRCSDAIPQAANSIGQQDWEAVETFATRIADDTVLPMRLYTSSLTGGGTNVKVSYTKDMKYVVLYELWLLFLLVLFFSHMRFIIIDR